MLPLEVHSHTFDFLTHFFTFFFTGANYEKTVAFVFFFTSLLYISKIVLTYWWVERHELIDECKPCGHVECFTGHDCSTLMQSICNFKAILLRMYELETKALDCDQLIGKLNVTRIILRELKDRLSQMAGSMLITSKWKHYHKHIIANSW